VSWRFDHAETASAQAESLPSYQFRQRGKKEAKCSDLYSYLSARFGWTRLARSAGMNPASAATAVSASVALRMSRYQREVADRPGLNRPTEKIPPARGSRTGG